MYFPSNSVQTIELIEEDILYRTNQMKSLCLEAEQAGIATVIHLADQGEQLQQIEQHLTSIDQNLAENKHRINRLKSFLERIRDFLRPKGQPKRLRKARKSEEVLSKTRCETKDSPVQWRDSPNPNDNLDQLIGRLRVLAQDMNDELIRQNDLLGHIHQDVLHSTNHLNEQNHQVNRLLFA